MRTTPSSGAHVLANLPLVELAHHLAVLPHEFGHSIMA